MYLKSGKITLNTDINAIKTHEKNYHFMVFSQIPTNLIKEKIQLLGIDFLEYIPNKAYVVSISKESNITSLSNFGIVALDPIRSNHKIDPKLQDDNFPVWAFQNNMLSIKLLLYKNADLSSFEQYCQIKNYQIANLVSENQYINQENNQYFKKV